MTPYGEATCTFHLGRNAVQQLRLRRRQIVCTTLPSSTCAWRCSLPATRSSLCSCCTWRGGAGTCCARWRSASSSKTPKELSPFTCKSPCQTPVFARAPKHTKQNAEDDGTGDGRITAAFELVHHIASLQAPSLTPQPAVQAGITAADAAASRAVA